MKALWFVLAALLFLASGLSAQRVRGELLVGVSRASYVSEYWYDTGFGPGSILTGWRNDTSGSLLRPVLGVAGSARIAGPLWLRAEAVAVTKGYAGRFSSHRVLFLEVPLLLQVEVPWRGERALRVIAGAAPSTEVSCSAHVQLPRGAMQWIGAPVPWPVPCSRPREADDVGGVFGIGFGPFEVGPLKLAPELRGVVGRLQRTDDHRSRHTTLSTLVNLSW